MVASERGLFRLEGDQLQAFSPGSPLAVNRVLSMYEDREGDLWLGTDSGGLHLLRDQKFTTYSTADGLSGNLVRCVFASAKGELWIGTDGAGLNHRTSTGFAHYSTAEGLSSNVILSLAGGRRRRPLDRHSQRPEPAASGPGKEIYFGRRFARRFHPLPVHR